MKLKLRKSEFITSQNTAIEKFRELSETVDDKIYVLRGMKLTNFPLSASILVIYNLGPLFPKQDVSSLHGLQGYHTKKKQKQYRFCMRCGGTASSNGQSRAAALFFEENHKNCSIECQNCGHNFVGISVYNTHLQDRFLT